MRKLLFIIPLGLSLTAMSCSGSTESSTQQVNEQGDTLVYKNVNVEEFSQLVSNADGQVLDVRTPGEWETGTIKDAIKIDYRSDDFESEVAKLDKNTKVYIYCRSGGRSSKAAKIMQGMGFTNIYNLNGGMGAWSSAGKEISK